MQVHCRNLVAVHYMNTQLFTSYLLTDNLHLLYCVPMADRQSHHHQLGRSRRRNTFSEIFKKLQDGNMMNIAKMT